MPGKSNAMLPYTCRVTKHAVGHAAKTCSRSRSTGTGPSDGPFESISVIFPLPLMLPITYKMHQLSQEVIAAGRSCQINRSEASRTHIPSQYDMQFGHLDLQYTG